MYGSAGNAVPKEAKDLINRIRDKEIKAPFTMRDVYHARHWSGLSTSAEVEEVLAYLVEKNYLASRLERTRGRPITKYWAHPQIFVT